MSEILNENNISQSSLNENESSKNKIEINNSKYRNNKISNFDNFSMESDEQNLLLSYNELTMSYNDNNKRSRLDSNLNNKRIKDALYFSFEDSTMIVLFLELIWSLLVIDKSIS